MLFVREIEYKIKTKNLDGDQKIKNFFQIYGTTNNVEDKVSHDANSLFLDDLFTDYEYDNSEEEY